MDRRHEWILTSRLEEAILNGCAYISWSELYKWYGVKRIAAGTWKDLRARWKELIDNDDSELQYVPGSGGLFVFDGERVRSA